MYKRMSVLLSTEHALGIKARQYDRNIISRFSSFLAMHIMIQSFLKKKTQQSSRIYKKKLYLFKCFKNTKDLLHFKTKSAASSEFIII